MAHLPGQGEDENYYDMIMISSPPMEFADFLPSSENGAKPHHRQNILSKRYSGQQDYAEFLEQNPSYVARQEKFQDSHHAGFVEDHIHHHEDLHFDSEMFANPNPHPNSNSNQIQNPNQNQNNIKVETPDLLSPTTIGPGYRSRNSDFASSQSIYSDTGSNAQSIFHDAASHFSGAAEPPTAVFFDQTASNLDTFNQEIALGESISSTNLAEMNLGNHAVFAENAYARSAYSNGQRYSSQDFQQNVPGVNLNEEPSFQSDTWRYNCGSPITGDAFPALQNMYDGYSNRLTENNLSSYNVKMENSDAKVTISIHQAPEYVAARTPSLFSNSSHNSLSGNKPNYSGNQLQPPGQPQRSRTPSITNVPPSPIQSWQHSASPSLNLPSPGTSVYSDIEDDTFLRPDDYQNMRRGRQSVHLQKVRSRSHSRSNSRSGSVSARSTSDFYDSGSEVDPNDPQDDADEARAAREKMLELASSATISKRTQIHPSSYACHLCEKKFTRPYNLKSHLRTHTDERPFICNICGKAFARQHDRKRHEELHSGEKKYQCRGILRDGTPFGCSRKFARADALRRHFQTESGKECIKLLVEEDAREQNENNGILSSGIQLPDGEFMNPNAPEIPVLSVSPPQ